jgi:hypothetical protein
MATAKGTLENATQAAGEAKDTNPKVRRMSFQPCPSHHVNATPLGPLRHLIWWRSRQAVQPRRRGRTGRREDRRSLLQGMFYTGQRVVGGHDEWVANGA